MSAIDASVPIIQKEIKQSSAAGRSVVDYPNLTDLREALESASIDCREQNHHADWKLPVPDPEAAEEDPDVELQRLWTLRSYLLLDVECEEAFDQLTEEARRHFNVPTCAISLVDLGRQFLFSESNATPPPPDQPPCKETPRSVAFCAHTILSKRGICVVPDTKQDDRFKHNKLVIEPPYLRFYAGVPLMSPEGYKLGTFCIEGPEPRDEGLTAEEQAKLHEYAARAMQLMVQRRQAIHEQLMAPIQDNLRRHAAVTTNLGGQMFNRGECVAAMKLFQESVQSLMSVSEGGSLPTADRQEEMAQILHLLSAENNTDAGRHALIERVKFLTGVVAPASPMERPDTARMGTATDSLSCSAFLPNQEGLTSSCRRPSRNDVPGVFGSSSRLKGSLGRKHPPTLYFSEMFRISMEESRDGKVDYRNFIIPLEQCSKATLFNMGLIHYHWGSPDTAMHFFDLAASLSKANTPLCFDPVVLACLNNMAQINLQYGKPNDAMELLADALTRGNAALAALYTDENGRPCSPPDMMCRQQDDFKSRRLRRKLARTVMNMGHVHFFNSEFDASMITCEDAIRLLHATNFEDAEAAAAWYNIGVVRHHQGNREEAIKFLDKFTQRAMELVGSNHQVANALHRKGQVMYEMGDLQGCVEPLSEALKIRRAQCSGADGDVAETLCLIGKVLLAREEYDGALSAFEESLAIMRSQPMGEEVSLDAAQAMLELGRAYHIRSKYTEALQVYTEVAGITKMFFGERHPYVARIVNIIGTILHEVGEVEESSKYFEEATKIFLEHGIPVETPILKTPIKA